VPTQGRFLARPDLESLEGRKLMTQGLAASPTAGAAVADVLSTASDPAYPHVASARLIRSGKAASGFAIAFTRPMDPATVGDVGSYYVSDPTKGSRKMARAHDLSATLLPLKSARYDPATNTVTLTTRKPLKPSSTYIVSNQNLFGSLRTASDYERVLSSIGHFTDTTGQALDGVGIFAVTVSKAHPDGVRLV